MVMIRCFKDREFAAIARPDVTILGCLLIQVAALENKQVRFLILNRGDAEFAEFLKIFSAFSAALR